MNDAGHELLFSIRCAKCSRVVDRWKAWRDPEAPGKLWVKVWCHGDNEKRGINLLKLDREMREGGTLTATAFDGLPSIREAA